MQALYWQRCGEMGEAYCYVYILASRKEGALYIGITSDLVGRVYQHKAGVVKGFTKKYEIKRLVYYEAFADIEKAILREKQVKKWNRSWKIRLIEERNPEWVDLYPQIAKP